VWDANVCFVTIWIQVEVFGLNDKSFCMNVDNVNRSCKWLNGERFLYLPRIVTMHMFFPICPLSFYIWLDLICIDWKLSMLQTALIFLFITHYPCFEELVPYPLSILWRFCPLPTVHVVKRFNVHLVRLNSHWLKVVHFDYFAN
jgi:hypothetical protein